MLSNGGMFGNNNPRYAPDGVYKDAGPPNFPAQYGTRVVDQNGVVWTQDSDGFDQYWIETGYDAPYTAIVWSRGNWPVTSPTTATAGYTVSGDLTSAGTVAAVYNIGGSGVAFDPSINTDYFTAFYVERAIRVYGLVLPILTALNGTAPYLSNVKVKASIYRCHWRSFPGMPWKLANTNAVFSTPATGLNLTGTSDILLIPYASGSTVTPIILPPGKYYIRHMWGARTNCQFAARLLMEPNTTTNLYRTDRYRKTILEGGTDTLNYNTTQMNEELSSAAVIGSTGSNSTTVGSVDHIEWGIWCEVLN